LTLGLAKMKIDCDFSDVSKIIYLAYAACRKWELGGCPDQVALTAGDAIYEAGKAVEWLGLENELEFLKRRFETRQKRIAAAAWLLLAAGTDEHGKSEDLELASGLFLALEQC
jgi:hypothetical protein